MSKLQLVNIIIFQWFFIRLAKCSDKIIASCKIVEVSETENGIEASIIPYKVNTYQWYSILFWVLPCTGWRNDYIFLNKKPKFIRCTRKYIVSNLTNKKNKP